MTTKNCANGSKLVLKDLCKMSFTCQSNKFEKYEQGGVQSS